MDTPLPLSLLAPERASVQPALMPTAPASATAAIASLALGGAERIVLDWAASAAARHAVELIVLNDVTPEWPVPVGVRVTRLGGTDLRAKLEAAARRAAVGNPVILCHLLTREERAALARGGAHPVPVLHNAQAGWRESAGALADAASVIAVSDSAVAELRAAGSAAHCAVVRHIPRTPVARKDARGQWRERWAVPAGALVIGMIGAVKPQKAYTRALRVLAAMLETRDAYLVIVGGPTGRDGALAWTALITQALRLGVESQVRLPGFVTPASDCLPAFDLLLNTSRYEGLSIATLEALAAGLPVVASAVGGQGELAAPRLTLLAFDAPDAQWANAIGHGLRSRPALPAWRGAPASRVWTLFHLAQPFEPGHGVLFVTANLNAGGAQRSLVNLALALRKSLDFEIAVCGESSAAYFAGVLAEGGAGVLRTAQSRDCFDHAEALTRRIVAGRFGTVCFWNVDAKVKLLLVKTFAGARVRFVDVSPGAYSIAEMEAARGFQQWTAYTEREYYARLHRFVMKYAGDAPPGVGNRLAVIPNGVLSPEPTSASDRGPPRIVVSGRIAPSKFLVEAVASMRWLWRAHPRAELHLLGTAEPRHRAYAQTLRDAIGTEFGSRIFVHGAAFDSPQRLARFTAALVLGEHQGSPNAVLEALAAGVPVVANDSGGTRELVIDGETGVLLAGCDPVVIATALARLFADPARAQRLAAAGRRHVLERFSMARMAHAYLEVLRSPQGGTRC